MSEGDRTEGAIAAPADSLGADAEPPKELVVGFWSLIFLAKLAVVVFGAGLLVLAFTSFRLVGIALVALAVVLCGRWLLMYRRVRPTDE